LTIPLKAETMVYGVTGDGKTKATVSFANSITGATKTLSTVANTLTTVGFGNVVYAAVNGVSNQFSGMLALTGKYKLSMVVTDLPLRQANGNLLPTITINVPTQLVNTNGNVVPSSIISVTGLGVEGYFNLK
jgi:hypothetical protein